jgi:hypothetical protein
MVGAVAIALLVAAAMVLLLVTGFFAGLASLDWLVVLALVGGAAAVGVMLYQGLLRSWIGGGSHPRALRLLTAVIAVTIWLGGLSAVFWKRFAGALAWPYEDTLGPLLPYLFLVLVLVLFAITLLIRGRTRFRAG